MIDFNRIFTILFLTIIFLILANTKEDKNLGSEIYKFFKNNKWIKRILRNIGLIGLIFYINKSIENDAELRSNYISNIIQYIYKKVFSIKIDNQQNKIKNIKEGNSLINVLIIYVFYILFSNSTLFFIKLSIIFIFIYYILSSINDINILYNKSLYNNIVNIQKIIEFIIITLLLYGIYHKYRIIKQKYNNNFKTEKFLFKSYSEKKYKKI
tara:strand:+ start:53 stop:685 length:633 start_codon:yes stop_codon:yes gene_type:complete